MPPYTGALIPVTFHVFFSQFPISEVKAKQLEDQLELRAIELRDSNEELEELRRLNDEKSSCKVDLEKVSRGEALQNQFWSSSSPRSSVSSAKFSCFISLL